MHRFLRCNGQLYALLEPLIVVPPFWRLWVRDMSPLYRHCSTMQSFMPHVRQVERSHARVLVPAARIAEKAMLLRVHGTGREFVVRVANTVQELCACCYTTHNAHVTP